MLQSGSQMGKTRMLLPGIGTSRLTTPEDLDSPPHTFCECTEQSHSSPLRTSTLPMWKNNTEVSLTQSNKCPLRRFPDLFLWPVDLVVSIKTQNTAGEVLALMRKEADPKGAIIGLMNVNQGLEENLQNWIQQYSKGWTIDWIGKNLLTQRPDKTPRDGINLLLGFLAETRKKSPRVSEAVKAAEFLLQMVDKGLKSSEIWYSSVI